MQSGQPGHGRAGAAGGELDEQGAGWGVKIVPTARTWLGAGITHGVRWPQSKGLPSYETPESHAAVELSATASRLPCGLIAFEESISLLCFSLVLVSKILQVAVARKDSECDYFPSSCN